jgi:hypothetical protein
VRTGAVMSERVEVSSHAARGGEGGASPEVSFVLPCLNEAATLGACLAEVGRTIEARGLDAEVIVADNGSVDGSVEVAERMGARVVRVGEKGYGRTLRAGLAAARGTYLVMGDSDGSYDFGESWGLIERLRAGGDVVLGSRLPAGGGRIEAGAMPWMHRWVGNPLLSWMGRRMYGVGVTDFHCGLRAVRRASYERLGVRTTGMEFASEMVVRAALAGMRIEEVGVTLRRDGRGGPSHLRRWRDGWRHLRFMLGLCPQWTLVYPGLVLLAVGLVLGAVVGVSSVRVAGVQLDVHTLVAASLMVVVGYQAVMAGGALGVWARGASLGRPRGVLAWVVGGLSIERGLIGGGVLGLVGLGLIGWVAWGWGRSGFGPLEVGRTLRPMVVGATLAAVGAQTTLAAFVCSALGLGSGGEEVEVKGSRKG